MTKTMPPAIRYVFFSFLGALALFGVWQAFFVPPCGRVIFGAQECPVGSTNTFSGTVGIQGGTSFTTTLSAAPTANQTWTFPDDTNGDDVVGDDDRHMAPTYIVCASTMTGDDDSCDYVANGTADQDTIQSAITACPAAGCWIHMTEGTFTFGSCPLNGNALCIDIDAAEITLSGSGMTTLLDASGVGSDDVIRIGNSNVDRIVVRDFAIVGAQPVNSTQRAIYFADGQDHVASGLYLDNIGKSAIEVEAEQVKILNNLITDSAHGITGNNGAKPPHDLLIKGNTIIGSDGDPDTGEGEIIYVDADRIIIEGNHLEIDALATGVTTSQVVDFRSDNGVLANNDIVISANVDASGTDLTGEGITVIGNTFMSTRTSTNDGAAIEMSSNNGVPVSITGNTIRWEDGNNDNSGILIQNAFVTVSNNVIAAETGQTLEYGIRVKGSSNPPTDLAIVGNVVRNADGAGIRVETVSGVGTVTDIVIANNVSTNNTGDGIEFAEDVDDLENIVVLGNVLTGNSGAAMSGHALITTGRNIDGNIGWDTETSGTGTINNAATSVTITHNLEITPAAGDCWIWMSENPTNAIDEFWIDTYTATQFNINSTDPGASNLDVGWACDID